VIDVYTGPKVRRWGKISVESGIRDAEMLTQSLHAHPGLDILE
jgi:hypothetical protein